MKTNVVMERKMGDFKVYQRIKDGMFNATDLLTQYNLNAIVKKTMGNYLRIDSTKELIDELNNNDFSKGVKTHLIKTRGKHGGTWMSPLLFIDFSMWLNSKFKVTVLQFVYDQLIEFRHSAGDNYNVLTAALSKFKNADYAKVAQALNYIIFGKHERNLRQQASSKQLDELTALENKLAFAINMGYIRSCQALIIELRKIWAIKYNPINKLTNE